VRGSKVNAKAAWSYLQYGSTLRFYSNDAGEHGEMETIPRSIMIEDLIHDHPLAVRIMVEKRLPCLADGEPVWETFEDVAIGVGSPNRKSTRFLKN
jgi:hypothetical protein